MHSKSSDSVAHKVEVEVEVATAAAPVPAREEDSSLPGVLPPILSVAAGSHVPPAAGDLVLYSKWETELAAGGQLGTLDHSQNTCCSEVEVREKDIQACVDVGCMHFVEEH